MRCRKCKTLFGKEYGVCPACGWQAKTWTAKRVLAVIAIAAVCILAAAVVAVCLVSTGDREREDNGTSVSASGGYHKQTSSETTVSKAPDSSSDLTGTSVTVSSEAVSAENAAPADIGYTLEHLSEAIRVWSNYSSYGAPCGFSDEIVYGEAWTYLTPSQSEWVCDLCCSECCIVIENAREQLGKYLSPGMYSDFSEEAFVEYRGLLYIALGGMGYDEYDSSISNSQVVRTAYNKLSVTVAKYDSGGDYYCDVRLDFEYMSGAYKIVKATELI